MGFISEMHPFMNGLSRGKEIINKETQGNFPEENASLLIENITQVPRIRDENRTLYMSFQNSREKNHVLQIVRYREGSRGKDHIQKVRI